jgi:streptogramin lyase
MANARRFVSVVSMGCLVVAITGCAVGQGPNERRTPTPDPTVTPSPVPTRSPVLSPSASAATVGNLAVRGEVVGTSPIEFALVTPTALVAQDWQPARIRFLDPATFEETGVVGFGSVAGQMPPDGQSVGLGREGIWITLAAQRAVALVDPATKSVIRRISVDGSPYNLVEHDGDLWIADFEGNQVLRVDIATGAQSATIPVRDPTGITFGEGSVWATVHVGRRDEREPIEGNGGQLAKIDPATNRVTALIDVGPRPYWVVTGFGSAWTGNATGGSVSRVDALTNAVTTIPVPADGAFDIDVIGSHVWVGIGPQYWSPDCDPTATVPSGAVVRIDPGTNQVDGRIGVPCAGGIVPDGDRFWVIGPDVDGVVGSLIEP